MIFAIFLKTSLITLPAWGYARRISTTPLSKFSVLLSRFLLAVFLVAAASAAPRPQLLVAAAADLHPLQQDLTATVARTLSIDLQFTFSASGVLARQIENGAPYDLFLSANEQFVRDLEGRGKLLEGTVTAYALGRLGLWSKSGRVRTLEDLAGRGIIHVALPNPAHAPYGRAAKDMLQAKRLWAAVEPRAVYGENVEQAFQFAESGNADACITAWTLVRNRGGILLAADHPPIRQVAAVVKASRQREAAARVLHWLAGPQGKALLERYGFGTP
jgi:molybdate transport system substrate-binding protein